MPLEQVEDIHITDVQHLVDVLSKKLEANDVSNRSIRIMSDKGSYGYFNLNQPSDKDINISGLIDGLAKLSQVPTNNNQLANGKDYATKNYVSALSGLTTTTVSNINADSRTTAGVYVENNAQKTTLLVLTDPNSNSITQIKTEEPDLYFYGDETVSSIRSGHKSNFANKTFVPITPTGRVPDPSSFGTLSLDSRIYRKNVQLTAFDLNRIENGEKILLVDKAGVNKTIMPVNIVMKLNKDSSTSLLAGIGVGIFYDNLEYSRVMESQLPIDDGLPAWFIKTDMYNTALSENDDLVLWDRSNDDWKHNATSWGTTSMEMIVYYRILEF